MSKLDLHAVVSKVKQLHEEAGKVPTLVEVTSNGVSDYLIRKLGGFTKVLEAAGLSSRREKYHQRNLRILVFDIETAPILAWVWQLWDQNVGLNQIKADWHVMAWAAKWLGEPHVYYKDQRDQKDVSDDRSILEEIWALLDEADVVVTQNGKKFDAKKLNARFVLNGMKPPSSYLHIDTRDIAKKNFGFTSNKLAYMTDKLNVKFKKLDHAKYPGFDLWKECLAGNMNAWKEMEKYNRHDVLSLEELYLVLAPWDKTVNFNTFSDDPTNVCHCGSLRLTPKGYKHTKVARYQRFICEDCGAEHIGRENMLSKVKRKSLLK